MYAGDSFLVPGATVATLLMLGFLHARRLYDGKKVIHWLHAHSKLIMLSLSRKVELHFLGLMNASSRIYVLIMDKTDRIVYA